MAAPVSFSRSLPRVPQPLQFRLQTHGAAEVPKADLGKLAAFRAATEVFHYARHGQGSMDQCHGCRHLGQIASVDVPR